jgi:dipeptide/tripeptide permease
MCHKFFKMAVWFITALVSTLVGAWVFGFDPIASLIESGTRITQSAQMMIVAVHGLALVAGVISLVMFFMAATGHCGCKKNGDCGNRCNSH